MQDFSLARRAMVDSQLRPEAVTDRGVLAAMATVERERFVPEQARALAYFDRPLRLAPDRAMMPPAALGRLLSELAPRPGERALVVGSGTGYAAAVLREIGLDVVALESDEALASSAREAGIETVIHVGPEANLIPATYHRLSDNVRQQLRGRSLNSLGLRAMSGMARRPWLANVLPTRAALLRAPFVEHVLLEDWLLEQRP